VSDPHTSPSREDDKAIYKHAFWLYGVLVGLSIKNAVDSVLPDWIHLGTMSGIVHPRLGVYLEVLRLFTFLFMAIRFYLGSAYYFGLVHESEEAHVNFRNRSFGSDFVLGFLHFLGFVFLALTLHVHEGEPLRLFPLGVAFILGYDVAWFVYSWLSKLDSRIKIKWWAIVNGATVIVAGLIYLLVERITANQVKAEIWAMWLVFIVTLLDIGWMMRRKPFFQPIRDLVT